MFQQKKQWRIFFLEYNNMKNVMKLLTIRPNEIIRLLKSSIVANDFSCIKLVVRTWIDLVRENEFPLASGHIQSRVVYFLMNIHVLPRTIYLTRVNFDDE